MHNQPFAVPAALFFIAALPLALGLLPPNRYYGFRTAKALSDKKIWYAVNRVTGLAVMGASCIYAVIAVLMPYNPAAADNFLTWAIHLAAFVVPLVIGLSIAARYARRH
jgi:uncharacterized membrane protein